MDEQCNQHHSNQNLHYNRQEEENQKGNYLEYQYSFYQEQAHLILYIV